MSETELILKVNELATKLANMEAVINEASNLLGENNISEAKKKLNEAKSKP
jgi:CMP-N-acetylneuraminic acid synthetase